MADCEFRYLEYGDGNSDTLVSLVAGFDGKIGDFEQAATSLLAKGNDVVVYEYDKDILTAGDPAMLPQIIGDLQGDFAGRARSHESQRHTGVSLGGGIAWNIQKAGNENVKPGLYAAAGANVARLIFRNPLWLFSNTRNEFLIHGHDEHDLSEIWQDIQEPPLTPFLIALGGLDFIVPRREVMGKVQKWQQAGLEIRTLKQMRGHTGMIKWFNTNILGLQAFADA